jgi:hypothetical protein
MFCVVAGLVLQECPESYKDKAFAKWFLFEVLDFKPDNLLLANVSPYLKQFEHSELEEGRLIYRFGTNIW